VPAAALREQQLFIRRSGQRRRRPAGRPSPRRKLDLGGGILATCLRQHLGISAAALAPLIGADPRTVSEAIKDTGSLLAQAGHVIPPGPARCRTLNDLREFAASHGLTLPEPAPHSTLTPPGTPQTHVTLECLPAEVSVHGPRSLHQVGVVAAGIAPAAFRRVGRDSIQFDAQPVLLVQIV